MALQDSGFIALSGSGDANVTSFQNLVNSGLVQPSGMLDATIEFRQTGPLFTRMDCKSSISVSSDIKFNIGKISFNGTLSASVSGKILVNSYANLYGLLSVRITPKLYIQCFELMPKLVLQVIESTGCSTKKGSSVALVRYRGDTYPVSAILSKNGDTDITGFIVKLSTQITGHSMYTSVGTITNAALGYVDFMLDPLAVATAGKGVYDIQVDDGTYIYTYEKGEFELLEDLTP